MNFRYARINVLWMLPGASRGGGNYYWYSLALATTHLTT